MFVGSSPILHYLPSPQLYGGPLVCILEYATGLRDIFGIDVIQWEQVKNPMLSISSKPCLWLTNHDRAFLMYQ